MKLNGGHLWLAAGVILACVGQTTIGVMCLVIAVLIGHD